MNMPEIFSQTSIDEVLNHEFAKRKGRNSAYSLRAFARDLNISPSRLSELLSGNNGLSEKMAHAMAEKLKFTALETSFWRDLVLAQCSRSRKVRDLARQRLEHLRKTETLQQIKEAQFRVIADWYHAAILELTQLTEFQPEVSWIADKLGISVKQTQAAIERLVQLGLLKINKQNWQVSEEPHYAFSDMPSSAIRMFHRQILLNALESIYQDAMQDREMESMIVAIPKSRMREFQQEMKKFLVQFWERLDGEPKDALYSLSVQLCPIGTRNKLVGDKHD